MLLQVLLLLLVLLFPSVSTAAESLVGSPTLSSWATSQTTPSLTARTTTSGSNKVVVAVITYYTEASATVSSYSFNSVSGSRCTSTNVLSAGGLGADTWIVKNPGTVTNGAQSLTFSAATLFGHVELYEVDGVDQTTPCVHGTNANLNTGPSNPSITVSTVAAGEITFAGLTGFSGIGAGTPVGNNVEDADDNNTGTISYFGHNTADTGSVVMQWNNSGGNAVMTGFSLAVASGSTPDTSKFRLRITP